MISHTYHDWLLTCIRLEGSDVVLTVAEETGQTATIRLIGSKHLLAVDFLMGNIISRIVVARVSDSNLEEVHKFFMDFSCEKYFNEKLDDFFSSIKNDNYVVEVVPTYGAMLCCICSDLQEQKG